MPQNAPQWKGRASGERQKSAQRCVGGLQAYRPVRAERREVERRMRWHGWLRCEPAFIQRYEWVCWAGEGPWFYTTIQRNPPPRPQPAWWTCGPAKEYHINYTMSRFWCQGADVNCIFSTTCLNFTPTSNAWCSTMSIPYRVQLGKHFKL